MHSELPLTLLCYRVLVIAKVYLWHPRSLWGAASARISHQNTRTISQIQFYDSGGDQEQVEEGGGHECNRSQFLVRHLA